MVYPEEEYVKFIHWMIRHKRSEMGILPPKYIIEIAKRNKWVYKGYAYRGMKLHLWQSKDKRISKKEINSNIRYLPKKKFESWTRSKHIAFCFSVFNSTMNLSKEVLLKSYIIPDHKHGIVIKGHITFGINLNEAMDDLDRMAEKNDIINLEMGKIPMLGSEGEILGISPKIVKIIEKVNC